MNPLIRLQKTTLVFLVAFACFPVALEAQVVFQEGCLTNENTVLGDDALLSLTSGAWNTALGFDALSSNTTGNFKPATGVLALSSQATANGVPRTLTFTERVSYQRAIEEVYWRHRSWK